MPIAKVLDPYTGGSLGGVIPSGEGGGSEPDPLILEDALDPEQYISETAESFTVEWPAPTGGEGGYSYSFSAKARNGTSITPTSGSGVGPYVVPITNYDGAGYIARLTVTSGSQSKQKSALISPAVPVWVEVADYDFTGLDSETLTSTGRVKKSTVDYGPQYKVVNHSSNNGTVTAGSSGIVVNGLNINSGLLCTFGLSELLEDLRDHVVWVDMVIGDVSEVDSGSDGWQVGFCDSNGNFASGNMNAVRSEYVSSTTVNIKTSTNNSTSVWLGTLTQHSSYVVSFLLKHGTIAEAFLTQNSETLPSAETIEAGGRLCSRTISAGGSPPFDANARFGLGVVWGGNATIKRMVVRYRKTLPDPFVIGLP